MNEIVKSLAEEAMGTRKHVPPVWQFYDTELEQFAELLIKDVVGVMKQEWYALNNIETQPSDTPRDIALRVGSKSEIIKLMHIIQKRYGVE